ncbi:MAG: hypothetical protein VX589_00395 [Myxococcota bacterium]|nr:hypothetical protein [Myxococcota bacterium]
MIEPITKMRPASHPDLETPPPIYIYADVLDEIRFSASWRADRIAGGVLVGRRYRCAENGADFVEVDGYVAGTHIDGIPAFMRYLRMQWKAARAALRYNFPEGEVVGWFIGSPSGQPVTNQDTLLLHHTYFSHPWQLGLWISGNDAPASLAAQGEELVTGHVGIPIVDERPDP